MGDRSLFFMTLAIICMWLVLDEFLGKKRISGWIASVMGGGSGETFTVPEENSLTNGLKDGNTIAESEYNSITYVPGVKVPITRPDDREDQPTYENGSALGGLGNLSNAISGNLSSGSAQSIPGYYVHLKSNGNYEIIHWKGPGNDEVVSGEFKTREEAEKALKNYV